MQNNNYKIKLKTTMTANTKMDELRDAGAALMQWSVKLSEASLRYDLMHWQFDAVGL
jgi:hypothetical protein